MGVQGFPWSSLFAFYCSLRGRAVNADGIPTLRVCGKTWTIIKSWQSISPAHISTRIMEAHQAGQQDTLIDINMEKERLDNNSTARASNADCRGCFKCVVALATLMGLVILGLVVFIILYGVTFVPKCKQVRNSLEHWWRLFSADTIIDLYVYVSIYHLCLSVCRMLDHREAQQKSTSPKSLKVSIAFTIAAKILNLVQVSQCPDTKSFLFFLRDSRIRQVWHLHCR